MSKLVEWVVVKQLRQHNYNNNNNILDNLRQSAYKSGHSMETTLLHIKNETYLSLSQGEPTALVFLDLSAVFDTIEFIIFGSYAQLKKFYPYLPVRIFGNFMHPAVVVKNLGVWFDAYFPFC